VLRSGSRRKSCAKDLSAVVGRRLSASQARVRRALRSRALLQPPAAGRRASELACRRKKARSAARRAAQARLADLLQGRLVAA
jgi:hypothetical protein